MRPDFSHSEEIGRVLANILYNAFESVYEQSSVDGPDYQPAVSISTSRADKMAVVRIADNGIGLPDGDVSQVFDPFFTTKPTGTGTGLGLSMSHDIVVGSHQGTLTAERTSDGAAFVIRLPI